MSKEILFKEDFKFVMFSEREKERSNQVLEIVEFWGEKNFD